MARIKNPLLSLKAIGKLGNITFRRSRKQTIAEEIPKPPDAKSPGQLAWRPMFLKCVDLWHTLSAAEKQIWESQARSRRMTGYAWYLSQCLRPNPGIYLPLVGGTMQGEIRMDGFHVHGLPAPVHATDATRKSFVDGRITAHAAIATVHQDAPALIATHAALPNVHHTPPVAPNVGEGHITIHPFAYNSIGQGTWQLTFLEAQWADHYWFNSPPADGDNISYKVFLAAGTYTLGLLVKTDPACGITDVYIDAAEVASFDHYTAGVVNNVWETQADIPVATAGLKTLKLQLDGKNASATQFILRISAIILWRTA